MLPSSAGLPFFALAVAAGRNLRRTRCRIRGVLPCGLQAGQHGRDPRAASLATGPFPDVDPHGSASGRHPTNFRLGFKRLPLQAWLASQRLPANGVPDAVRDSLRKAPASTDSADVPCGKPARPVTVHALAPHRAFTLWLEQAGIQGFQLRSAGRAVGSPSASLPIRPSCFRYSCRPAFRGLAPVVGIKDSAPRRGGGQAARDPMQLSWVSGCPPGFDRTTLPGISPPLPSRSCRTAQAVAGASRCRSVALR